MTTMKITATLEAIYSKRDMYGNCYWALRYCDHATGRYVCGAVSGGESNIYGILRENDTAQGTNDWDRSIRFLCTQLPIREFNRLTDDWPHAGCTPADLWQFIKRELAAPPKS